EHSGYSARRAWHDDLEARDVRVECLDRLRVIERAVDAATPGHADDEGHAVSAVAAVADTRGLVDDLLEGGCAEIRELHLGDRQEPAERCTDGDADDRRLRDRCVDDPVAPELLDEPIGHAEHTAADADVLAHEDVPLVAAELGE